MPNFRNIWLEDGSGQVSKCVDCGEIVNGFSGVIHHKCKEYDNMVQYISDAVEFIHAPDHMDGTEGLLAIIVRRHFSKEGKDGKPDYGIEFFTEPKHALQLAFMNRPAGHVVPKHRHASVKRETIGTQEVLIIRFGFVMITLYTSDGCEVCSRHLGDGDIIMLVAGGHKLEFIEPTTLYEVKGGPYFGPQDKELM